MVWELGLRDQIWLPDLFLDLCLLLINVVFRVAKSFGLSSDALLTYSTKSPTKSASLDVVKIENQHFTALGLPIFTLGVANRQQCAHVVRG